MNKLSVVLFADSDDTRRHGLMFHRPLKIDECALFFFPQAGKHSFWNKNVSFPISLIFCDKHGKIEDIQYLEAQQTSAVIPKSNRVVYVIEAHKDVPKELGLKKDIDIRMVGREVVFDG